MFKLKFLFVSAVFSTLISCTSDTAVVADCTTITGATFSTNSGKLSSMIQSKCSGSTCHSPGGKEAKEFLATTDYNAITSFLSRGATSVLNGSMPEGSKLSTAELELWQCWKESGFPQ